MQFSSVAPGLVTPPIVLTIAGSDSGGGAGLQADLRTFAQYQVHGTVVVTAITAQNSQGVSRVDPMLPDGIKAQFAALLADFPIQALKTGVLVNPESVTTVTSQLRNFPEIPKVIDPVMVSRAGTVFVDGLTVEKIKTELIPQAWITTPNRYEAQILAEMEITTLEEMQLAAQKIRLLGPQAVLIKGGAMPGMLRGLDVWCDESECLTLTTETIATPHTHGSGCTLGAAITANLALGHSPLNAVKQAKQFVTQALRHSYPLGHGQGPLGHFFVERQFTHP